MAKAKPEGWQNRIVGQGDEDPEQLAANPRNWRIHPKNQQEALTSVLDKVGWVTGVIVNRRTGFVVDGHLRVSLALRHEEDRIPVQYVDLDEAEEQLVLATIDPIAAMASSDREKLSELLDGIKQEDGALADLLKSVREEHAFLTEDAFQASGTQPRGFRTMSFVLSEEQASIVEEAVRKAAETLEDDAASDNRNGRALAAICQSFNG